MNIINRMINIAQSLDNLNLYREADLVTKIANSINLIKTSNLISPDNMFSKTKILNDTVIQTNKAINSTKNLRETNSSADDDDNDREAGFVNTTQMPYIANQVGNQVKNTNRFLNDTQRERSKTANLDKKVAKTINLQGISNTVKDQVGRMRETTNVIKNVSEQRNKPLQLPLAKNKSEEKTGERDEEEDKKAISLSALPQKAKNQVSLVENTVNTIKQTEQQRKK